MKLDIEKVPVWYLEKAINDTFPGAAIYVRDCNLSAGEESRYQKGMIILEKGFVEATSRVLGMATTHRFAIISNHMKDITPFIKDKEKKAWGLCVTQANSRFKIIDTYEYQGKTQILLLHLPNDERWQLFRSMEMNIEEELIGNCRQRFEGKCSEGVIPELATRAWLDRCSFLIGFDDDGQAFPLDFPIEKRMKPFEELDFREVFEAVRYIKDGKEALQGVEEIFEKDSDSKDMFPDSVVYGYIDEEAGLSVRVLGSARLVNREPEYIRDVDEYLIVVRSGALQGKMVAQVVDSSLSIFAECIDQTYDAYKPKNTVMDILRDESLLDAFRHPQYPDDIKALLFKDGIEGVEQVWLRTCHMADDAVFGELLNEPNQDFGVHVGDVLPISFVENDNELICVCDLNIANNHSG